jgi:hypothetical protein
VATVAAPVAATPFVDGLGADGTAFMRAMFAEYVPTEGEGHILRLAAHALDDHAAARAARDLKAARAAVRQVLAVLQRLGIPAPKVS